VKARNTIYVATSREGPVKIGISIDPWRRFAHGINNEGNCELKFIVECESRNDARRIESAVKSDIWRKCHKGEWFNVPAQEMISRISGIAEELGCRIQFIHPTLIKPPPPKPHGGVRPPRRPSRIVDDEAQVAVVLKKARR
jgi:hypothetical protein